MSEKLSNNTSDIPTNTKTEAVIKAPDEWKKVPEVKETQKDTQKKLEDLKKERTAREVDMAQEQALAFEEEQKTNAHDGDEKKSDDVSVGGSDPVTV